VGVHVQRTAIGREVEAPDRAIEVAGQDLQLAVDRVAVPVGAGDLAMVVDVLVDGIVGAQ
jgi:hypothetical protein